MSVPPSRPRPPRRPPLRLRLDADDLARVRVRPGGGPFAESLFSLQLLRQRHPSAFASPWLKLIRASLGPGANPLALSDALAPVVDAHAVVWRAPSISEALELLHSETGATSELGQWFFDYYLRAVDPHWKRIRAHLEAERARCGRAMADGGVDHLLATLHPRVGWRAPVLEVDVRDAEPGHDGRAATPTTRDADPERALGGRSLVCVPSVFSADAPRVLLGRPDATLPALLVYPALRRMDDAASLWSPRPAPNRGALAKLLGRTQAAVLAAVADTCTTTELAHRVGIATPTASHHAGILRGAGLISSRRAGSAIVHQLTSLGADVLGQGEPRVETSTSTAST